MSKITNVRLPNAAEKQYSPQQFDQLVRSLEQIILALNTGYTPITTENNDQAVSWFEGSGMLSGTEGGSLPLLPYGAWQDFASTTLDVAINNSVTTIATPANGTTAFPSSGQIRIESEIISYTGKTTSSFSGCTRGAFGTTAASHSVGVGIIKVQCLAANTSGPMYMNQTDSTYDTALVSTTQLTTYQPGVYNLQWSGQFVNSDTQLHDVSVWVRINGVDVSGSMGFVSVPNSHGGIDGHAIIGWNYYLTLNANDYVELYWSPNNQKVTLECIPTQTGPTRPSTASVIATLAFVSSIA
jgi:hypothetical protein